MRRRYLPLLLGVLLLAGCGKPAGVDGNLMNGWPVMGAAHLRIPHPGDCFDNVTEENSGVWDSGEQITSCASPHYTETAYVGQLTGAEPVVPDSDAKQAYATCMDEAATYLGAADYHTERVYLAMILPTPTDWASGAHWFRCDLSTVDPSGDYQRFSASVHGDATGSRAQAQGCDQMTDDGKHVIVTDVAVVCAAGHNTEFAGLTTTTLQGAYDETALNQAGDDDCEGVIAKYLGLSGGKVTNTAIGWVWGRPSKDAWNLGDRTLKCWADIWTGNTINNTHYTGSVKGIGNGKP